MNIIDNHLYEYSATLVEERDYNMVIPLCRKLDCFDFDSLWLYYDCLEENGFEDDEQRDGFIATLENFIDVIDQKLLKYRIDKLKPQ
jgi:hypothetical protein